MCDNDPQYGTVIDPGYFEWLAALDKPVYYQPPIYEGLTGKTIPWDKIKEKHCGYFLDSTIAWMMAFCYEFCEVDEIGLYGVDFATDSERVKQRKGTKHFAELFRMKGVKVTIPDISEIAFDPEPYPHESIMGRKYHTHLKLLEPKVVELEAVFAKNEEQNRDIREQLERIRGTMQTLLFFKDNWS